MALAYLTRAFMGMDMGQVLPSLMFHIQRSEPYTTTDMALTMKARIYSMLTLFSLIQKMETTD
ncbi:MAG: hypothetical protein ABIM17_03595 [candidate division WOR-3 bacterium]